MMPKYKLKLKEGQKSLIYPKFGEVTQEHLDGPSGETFIKAFQKLDEKNKTKNFDLFIEKK